MKHTILGLSLLLLASCAQKEHIDKLITAKKVYSVDSSNNTYTAIAIDKGKIIALGNEKSLNKIYDFDTVINVDDKYVYPGLIDGHCHFSSYALTKYMCDLTGTKSWQEVIERLIDYEKNNKFGWIYARGWDQNDWDIKEYPTNELLNKYFTKPVYLKRIDGHAMICNQIALNNAEINTNTVIKGGIVEIENGKLTGLLIDNAMEPIEITIPKLDFKEALSLYKTMEQECYSYGLTAVVDCGVQKEVIEQLTKLYRDNELTIGNTLLLANNQPTLDAYLKLGPQEKGQLRWTGIKVYADGALGSRGACLLKEYADMPNHYGLILTSEKDILNIAKLGKQYNWQICTHAIGDSANRMVLSTYKNVLSSGNRLRWRIEHAQVIDNQDYETFLKYAVIPSIQPTHALSDMPWAANRLGNDRIKNAYAYNKLLQSAGLLALGTDFPVEGINPIATFCTAVFRTDKYGEPKNGFQMENALSRIDALRGMTIWNAQAVFIEDRKGSIEIGKDADLTILDTDLLNDSAEKIWQTKVYTTIVLGNVVYKQ